MKKISILGSTGSIGSQALAVVEAFPERLEVVALAAGRNVEKLAAQAIKHRPKLISIADPEDIPQLRALLGDFRCEILAGDEGLEAAAAHPDADLVLSSLVGIAGLPPTLAALEAGRDVALANKESLVAGGSLVHGSKGAGGGSFCLWTANTAPSSSASRAGRSRLKPLSSQPQGPFPGSKARRFSQCDCKRGVGPPKLANGCKNYRGFGHNDE